MLTTVCVYKLVHTFHIHPLRGGKVFCVHAHVDKHLCGWLCERSRDCVYVFSVYAHARTAMCGVRDENASTLIFQTCSTKWLYWVACVRLPSPVFGSIASRKHFRRLIFRYCRNARPPKLPAVCACVRLLFPSERMHFPMNGLLCPAQFHNRVNPFNGRRIQMCACVWRFRFTDHTHANINYVTKQCGIIGLNTAIETFNVFESDWSRNENGSRETVWYNDWTPLT